MIALAALAGCTDRPRAPALRDESVFDNTREGIRFLTPSGWTLQARSEVPPGPADTERLLVRYAGPPSATPPSFEVALQDLAESTDLVAHLKAPSHSITTPWNIAEPAQPLTIGGAAGNRFTFSQGDITKETVAFRRGARVYFFTGIFATADTQSRDQIRQAVQSLSWTK